MAIVISGKDLAKRKKDLMKEQVLKFENKYGRKPTLAVILVGDDIGSQSYVAGKEKACNEVGIGNITIRKPANITQAELLSIITDLNYDDNIDGILVQLPLPKHINQTYVIIALSHQRM